MTPTGKATRMTPDMFAARRRRLAEKAGADVIIIPAAHEATRSRDTEFPFRQDSDFLYLTGFPEPDAIAVLRPGHEKPYVLFVRPRDREREIWTGFRAGAEGAVEKYGADEAHALSEWPRLLPELLSNQPRVSVRLGQDAAVDKAVIETIDQLRQRGRQGIEAPAELRDPSVALADMRLFKGPEEIPFLQQAADITVAGHIAAMQQTRPDMMEFEIQALLEYEFRRRGAAAPGYGSIVAGGANATILHYVENAARMADGDLLLIDAGAEYQGYTGDVTRTFPIGRTFEGAAREVYEIVLAAQEAALAASLPGQTLDAVHQAAVRTLTQGLRDLGVLEGEVDGLIEQQAYRPFYMHGTSHWLGLDVHDVGTYKLDGKARALEPGMVYTVEPGLYFHADSAAPERLHGIGIRIEDDILITDQGHKNLTEAVPKSIKDIEELRRQAF